MPDSDQKPVPHEVTVKGLTHAEMVDLAMWAMATYSDQPHHVLWGCPNTSLCDGGARRDNDVELP
jgi:hypothetical protein